GAEPACANDGYQLLRVADWEEGIALRPSLGLETIQAVAAAKVRWVVREPGSGAQQCLDEIINRTESQRPMRRWPQAFDHRGVAGAIRGDGADAGVCLRLTSSEAELGFLSIRQEAYELCLPEPFARDPRALALVKVVRSTSYRRLLA